MADLSRKRERDRLPLRPDPYYQRLSEGAYLGFRRGPETWLARYRGRDRKQLHKPLGENLDFDQAKKLAEEWIAQLTGSAVRTVTRATVRDALEAYLLDLRRHGRHDAAKEAEWRFKTTVYRESAPCADDDALAGIELEASTREDFLEWRDRLVAGRQPRTVNRYVRAVAAGLNRATELGHVGNAAAWTLTQLADDVEDEGATAVFLTPVQRRGLIAAATPRASAFLRGLDLCGARPKELAEAHVSAFDGKALRLAHRKGRPPKLKTRLVVLSEEGVTFFKEQAHDKLPGAYLFTEDGKHCWRRHTWAAEVRAAITKHNEKARGADRVSDGVGAYAFRHARISELLQIYEIDPLTVAAQTGTSLGMIERVYFKFIPSAMRKKLAALTESA